jgi:A/G-specific adenine glycosylase
MRLAGAVAKRKKDARAQRSTARQGPLNHQDHARALLAWYDRHRRALPWRALPGERPDPYRVWLSEIMLQQTTVRAVAPYFERFVRRWPHVHALAAASLDDVLKLWAGLGYYARARHLHACAKTVVEQNGGRFPARSEAELANLPGIGVYTAAAIAAIAFDAPAIAIDGNAERVLARFFAFETELPGAKPRLRELAQRLLPGRRSGDFAQALMDLGATICTPKKPACVLCPWMQACVSRRRGDPQTFPRKAPKRAGDLRRGAAFVLLRADGTILLRTRPSEGLLGGMTEVPTTDWTADFSITNALACAPRPGRAMPEWRRLPGVVTHTFTHFPLELFVYAAKVDAGTPQPGGTRWVPVCDLAGEALPNVMRKVVAKVVSGE